MKKSFSIITLVLALIITPIGSIYAEPAEEVIDLPIELTVEEVEDEETEEAMDLPIELTVEEAEGETYGEQPETVRLTMSEQDTEGENKDSEELIDIPIKTNSFFY